VTSPYWFVYVLVSASLSRTYVGVAIDVGARLAQHNGERPRGARTTRAGRPWRVGATYGPYATRADAQRIEHRVKRLRGLDRLMLLPASVG
jgi:putative endonuclease